MDVKDIKDEAERLVHKGSKRAEIGALIALALVEVVNVLNLIHERMTPRE